MITRTFNHSAARSLRYATLVRLGPVGGTKKEYEMCLEVFAIPAQENRVSARRLSEVSGLRVEKLKRSHKGALSFSRDGGCSCSLMSDDADWNKPVWDLEPEILEPLAKALQILGEESGGFSLQAIWIGDSPETTSEITLTAMLQVVRKNQVRNKHIYRVIAV